MIELLAEVVEVLVSAGFINGVVVQAVDGLGVYV